TASTYSSLTERSPLPESALYTPIHQVPESGLEMEIDSSLLPPLLRLSYVEVVGFDPLRRYRFALPLLPLQPHQLQPLLLSSISTENVVVPAGTVNSWYHQDASPMSTLLQSLRLSGPDLTTRRLPP